ncbi:MAG: sulfotransferase, partial [Pseudomonadota bacterium]
MGEYEGSIAIYQGILKEHGDNARAWLSLGHALKTAGRQDESVAAYVKSAELAPHFGEAFWSLANMKTYRFDDASIAAMRAELDRPGISDEDRLHLHYALGKALEDAKDYSGSFTHYAEGARIRRAQLGYSADETSAMIDRSRALFTADFFAARQGVGSSARDPIFIVGLPRAGSTLVEQILSSHSAVEGTMELPDILMMARRLGGGRSRGALYPDVLGDLTPDQLRELGEEYIERTRIQRKTDAPFFIDKMPNNFQHLGLIHLILPNAKIIDARRHPMGCCFSAFKQHFARGQSFSYDFNDLGRYYTDYVRWMAHVDAVLPGRVHRVIYEQVVADPETQIRALLTYCGLPFEQACLDFHTTKR